MLCGAQQERAVVPQAGHAAVLEPIHQRLDECGVAQSCSARSIGRRVLLAACVSSSRHSAPHTRCFALKPGRLAG